MDRNPNWESFEIAPPKIGELLQAGRFPAARANSIKELTEHDFLDRSVSSLTPEASGEGAHVIYGAARALRAFVSFDDSLASSRAEA
ncbi:MAG: hypothetical protein ACJ8GN_31550 [Longimicrobiaceae bacterium]